VVGATMVVAESKGAIKAVVAVGAAVVAVGAAIVVAMVVGGCGGGCEGSGGGCFFVDGPVGEGFGCSWTPVLW
jgi:hypothetical protein